MVTPWPLHLLQVAAAEIFQNILFWYFGNIGGFDAGVFLVF
jgi:hypothetical protein